MTSPRLLRGLQPVSKPMHDWLFGCFPSRVEQCTEREKSPSDLSCASQEVSGWLGNSCGSAEREEGVHGCQPRVLIGCFHVGRALQKCYRALLPNFRGRCAWVPPRHQSTALVRPPKLSAGPCSFLQKQRCCAALPTSWTCHALLDVPWAAAATFSPAWRRTPPAPHPVGDS